MNKKLARHSFLLFKTIKNHRQTPHPPKPKQTQPNQHTNNDDNDDDNNTPQQHILLRQQPPKTPPLKHHLQQTPQQQPIYSTT